MLISEYLNTISFPYDLDTTLKKYEGYTLNLYFELSRYDTELRYITISRQVPFLTTLKIRDYVNGNDATKAYNHFTFGIRQFNGIDYVVDVLNSNELITLDDYLLMLVKENIGSIKFDTIRTTVKPNEGNIWDKLEWHGIYAG